VLFDTFCVSFSFVFFNFLFLKLQFMRIQMYIIHRLAPLGIVCWTAGPRRGTHRHTSVCTSTSGRQLLFDTMLGPSVRPSVSQSVTRSLLAARTTRNEMTALAPPPPPPAGSVARITMRDAIFTCARMLTRVRLVCRTEPKLKKVVKKVKVAHTRLPGVGFRS